MGVSQDHAQATLPLGKRPGTHCTGGWVGLRSVWTVMVKRKFLVGRGISAFRYYILMNVIIKQRNNRFGENGAVLS